jgi:hypothetical protein
MALFAGIATTLIPWNRFDIRFPFGRGPEMRISKPKTH